MIGTWLVYDMQQIPIHALQPSRSLVNNRLLRLNLFASRFGSPYLQRHPLWFCWRICPIPLANIPSWYRQLSFTSCLFGSALNISDNIPGCFWFVAFYFQVTGIVCANTNFVSLQETNNCESGSAKHADTCVGSEVVTRALLNREKHGTTHLALHPANRELYGPFGSIIIGWVDCTVCVTKSAIGMVKFTSLCWYSTLDATNMRGHLCWTTCSTVTKGSVLCLLAIWVSRGVFFWRRMLKMPENWEKWIEMVDINFGRYIPGNSSVTVWYRFSSSPRFCLYLRTRGLLRMIAWWFGVLLPSQ